MSPTVELSSRWLLYLVALGLGLLLLGLATLGWRRYLGASAAGSPLRVAKNSLFPLATSLLNRLLDLGFAIVLLKALGPSAIATVSWPMPLGPSALSRTIAKPRSSSRLS